MIKNLENNEKPRERLIQKGVEVLSNIELLAIILGSGTKTMDVLALSEKILSQYSICELKDLNYEKMVEIHGIKQAKACQLIASFELARRAVSVENDKESLDTPKRIFEYIRGDFYLASQEVLLVVFVDCKLRPIKKKNYTSNSTHQIGIPIKDLVSDAIVCHAYGIVMAHNHPSGSLGPSSADIESTNHLYMILEQMDILLLDHLIVSYDSYYSMLEHGIIMKNNPYTELGDMDEENWN